MAEVKDNPSANRYEVWEDGRLAGFTVYHSHKDRVAFVHTETEPAFAGRGLGKVLAAGALDDVRTKGLGVLPFCAFIRGFIAGNPEYVDLVPEAERERFDLA